MRRGGSALWYVVAVVLAIASVVAAIALAVLTLVGETGNKDRYGRVPIPASQVVALDSGEVALNYEERTDVDDGEGLSVPTDLRVTVTAQGDERPLDLEDSSLEESYNYNDRAGHSYARVDIPEEGRYRVRTAGATNRNRPSIAFGSPPHYGRGLLLALASSSAASSPP